jgi:hypothetical protein
MKKRRRVGKDDLQLTQGPCFGPERVKRHVPSRAPEAANPFASSQIASRLTITLLNALSSSGYDFRSQTGHTSGITFADGQMLVATFFASHSLHR